ncbi:hypothetical protein [Natrinema salaciae]|uniref:Envelope protein N-terminal domain-containing protein n=1 Tax=Natrinema salaciae TaxID=1186196 RepID=A0A1H9LWL2_9EURY|nr:hypothetical protein [Natrinema salaciae]SER15233.1 hypothetical protein SAMN04489841_3097 [Natrinema salaciae]
MSAQRPQPTDHDPTPGRSLTRRQAIQSLAAAGTIGAGVAASSGTGAADEGGWGGTGICSDYSSINVACQAGAAANAARNGLGMLFGSSDGDSDQFEEYLEDETLRIHGDAYRHGLTAEGSFDTTLTWVKDNVSLLEGRAYIRGLLRAYDAVEDENATRDEAIAAGKAGVDEIYSVPQREIIEEFHLHIRETNQYVDQMRNLYQDDSLDGRVLDHFYWELRSASTYNSDDEDYKWDVRGKYESQTDGTAYELFDGTTLETFSPYYNFEAGTNGISSIATGLIHIPALKEYASPVNEDDQLAYHSRLDGFSGFSVEVRPFDAAEYRSVYDEEFDAVDGRQVLYETEPFNDAANALLNAHQTAVDNVEAFIDQEYAKLVDGEIDREEIQSLDTMVEDISDDEPLAWVNTHLAMLGNSPSESFTTVKFGERTGWDESAGEHPDDPEYHPDDDDMIGLEVDGSLHFDTPPSNPLEVGETYTAKSIAGDVTPNITFSYGFKDDEGNERANIIQLADDREFTVTSAERLDDNGEVEEVDEITFSSSLPTETPTDYDELHTRLDEMDQFQREVLEKQQQLIEQLAKDDDDDGPGWPGVPDLPDGAAGQWLGLGIVGVVVLAVIGIVTDLVPGLGE